MKKHFYIFLFFVIPGSIAFAQFDELYDLWKWSHFTTNEGLPSVIVKNIVETSDSTVWVSTSNGIAWFDGYCWNAMGLEEGLPAGEPQKITAGIHGQLLALWDNTLYVGDKKGFKRFSFPAGFTNDSIDNACRNDENSILVIKKHHPVIVVIRNEELKEIPLPTGYTFWVTNSEGMWFNSKTGFIKISADASRTIIIKGFSGFQLTPRMFAENDLGDGLMSIDSPKEYIGICEWTSDNTLRYSKTERGISVRAMDMFPNGDALAIYETGDVHARKQGKWYDVKPFPAQMSNASVVRCRMNGDFWIGSENGLYLFRRSFNQWEKHLYPFADRKNMVMEIFRSSKNELWIGTLDGLEIIGSDGNKRNISSMFGKKLGLVTGINEDVDGSIWISSGSAFSGAYRWDGRSWSYYGPAEGLNAPFIHKIRKARNGDLVFLGLGKAGIEPGVFIYNRKKFSHIGVKEGLLDGRAYSFVEDSSGARWYGTQEGLSRYKNGKWKYWGYNEFAKRQKVYTMTVDVHNRVWFSNFAATLGYVDHNDSIHWVWRWDGQESYINKVWDLQSDSSGVVWLATTKGLYQYKDSILSWCANGAGMNIRELRVVLPLNNKIYVGGHGTGFNIYHPMDSDVPLKVTIEDPIVESDNVQCEWKVYSYWGGVLPQNIETRYQLDNGDWSAWSQDRKKYHLGLSYGQHSFRVQAKSRYNVPVFQSALTVFEIPLPLYGRTVFLLPIGVLLIAIFFLVRHNRSLRNAQRSIVQKNREKIAIDLHDEIGSNLSGIAISAQLKARDNRFTERDKKDFNEISQMAIQTANAMRDIVWFINPQNDSLEKLLFKMKETGTSLLRSMDVQFELFDPSRKRIPIEYRRQMFLLYKEALNNIAKHSGATNVHISLLERSKTVRLTIIDNGKGFDRSLQYSGSGLKNMKQRASACNGKLNISSNEQGTTIELAIPLSS